MRRSLEIERSFEKRGALWVPRYAPRAPQYRHGFDGPRRVPAAGGGGGGSPTRSQISNYRDLPYTSPASTTVTLSSAVGAGSVILVAIAAACGYGDPPATISDGTNTYTLLGSKRAYAALTYTAGIWIWYAKNVAAAGGGLTITATAAGGQFDGNQHVVMQAIEYSGVSTTAPIKNYSFQSSEDPGQNNVDMKSGTFVDAASSLDVGFGTAHNITYGWTASGSWAAIGSPSQGAFWIEQASVNGSAEATGSTGSNNWAMAGLALQ